MKKKIRISKLKPAPGYITLLAVDIETAKKVGALMMPPAPESRESDVGLVVAIGEDQWRDGNKFTAPAKVGDYAAYKHYHNNELKAYNGDELQTIAFEDVIGTVEIEPEVTK